MVKETALLRRLGALQAHVVLLGVEEGIEPSFFAKAMGDAFDGSFVGTVVGQDYIKNGMFGRAYHLDQSVLTKIS
jgi:hypothetical protein